jgi:hypothetical protein
MNVAYEGSVCPNLRLTIVSAGTKSALRGVSMSQERRFPSSPSNWTEAIDRIEKTISGALEGLDRREAAYPALPRPAEEKPLAIHLADAGNQWNAVLARACQAAGEADAELSNVEEAMREWLRRRERVS